jgi:60 kDa SS-A/Ro ribonucleoprotein
MNDYRRTINPAARLIVAGMTATDDSVVSPNDALGLNVAGFDANAPGIISNFIRGFDSDDVESFSGEE